MSTPWTPEIACDFARAHVEDGDFNGAFVIAHDDEVGIVPCLGHHPQETISMLGLMVLSGQLGQPQWILFAGDTYAAAATGPDMTREDLPDNLQEAFEAGDDRITEALAIACLSPDGPSYYASQPYVRDEGEIDWGEIQVTRDLSGLGGNLIVLMESVLAAPSGLDPTAAENIGMARYEL